jgi:hypothetical protein
MLSVGSNTEEQAMKSTEARKPRNRPSNKKLRDGKGTRESQAQPAKTIDRAMRVNRDNTLANWVADMRSKGKRGGQRGDTLGSWTLDAC